MEDRIIIFIDTETIGEEELQEGDCYEPGYEGV